MRGNASQEPKHRGPRGGAPSRAVSRADRREGLHPRAAAARRCTLSPMAQESSKSAPLTTELKSHGVILGAFTAFLWGVHLVNAVIFQGHLSALGVLAPDHTRAEHLLQQLPALCRARGADSHTHTHAHTHLYTHTDALTNPNSHGDANPRPHTACHDGGHLGLRLAQSLALLV